MKIDDTGKKFKKAGYRIASVGQAVILVSLMVTDSDDAAVKTFVNFVLQ